MMYSETLILLIYNTIVMVALDLILGKFFLPGVKIKDQLTFTRITMFTCLAGLHIVMVVKSMDFFTRMLLIFLFVIIYNSVIAPILKKIVS